ncbi:hypothetical protein [Candidatus Nitrotoga sp. M5]|uniref:hypothetical protein n=1 Tax=Candidatus Nitrotoga sp. M5 TaxID=2890409 RepID=UPI001EF5BA32|nr:hypothetical protein [Candidatus Nitrotoga sp. M5]CAH1387058.1 Exonuclease SbcC [Candidatus Nitrotoga sp. M5]
MKKPRPKKPRKHRPASHNGGLALLNQCTMAPLDETQLRDLGLAYLGALRGMATGHGTQQLWGTLACSINVAMVLAENGVRPQGLAVIQQGQDALLRIKAHAQQSGVWTLGIHAFALDCAFKFHNEQLKEAGRAQIITALAEVHRRVDNGQHL